MLLIFDWDGTLADSEAHIVCALQQAGGQLGLAAREYRQCAELIGLGLADATRRLHPGLDDAGVRAFCDTYSNCFRRLESEGHGLRLFDGVRALLGELREAGHVLAIATGKSRRGLDRALASSALGSLFAATRTADESASKPDPRMLLDLLDVTGASLDNAVMIGDTSYDMQMACTLGMDRVAATYGVHDTDTLLEYSPSWLIDSPAGLLAWPRIGGIDAKCPRDAN